MEFVNYLKEHPELIASAVCVVLTIILLFIKRRPKTVDEFSAFLSDVLTLVASKVKNVEVPGHGDEKREKVITSCVQEMSKRLQRKLSSQEESVIRFEVSEQIDDVLDAPHRKENF